MCVLVCVCIVYDGCSLPAQSESRKRCLPLSSSSTCSRKRRRAEKREKGSSDQQRRVAREERGSQPAVQFPAFPLIKQALSTMASAVRVLLNGQCWHTYTQADTRCWMALPISLSLHSTQLSARSRWQSVVPLLSSSPGNNNNKSA